MPALRRKMLEVLIPGMTHVIERDGKEAFVYFENGDSAHMLLDGGETRTGRWRILDDGYAVEWNNGVTGRWQLEHEPGSVTYVSQDRDLRLRLIGVLFGNPHDLPR